MASLALTLRKFDHDSALLLAAFLVASAAGLTLLLDRGPRRSIAEGERIATLTYGTSDLRRRPSGSLVWEELDQGAALFEADALFVSGQGEANVSFADGSELELGENSLVVVKRPAEDDDGTQVALLRGSVAGRGGSNGLQISSDQTVAELQGNTEARVVRQESGNAYVEVHEGAVDVKHAGVTRRAVADEAVEIRGASMKGLAVGRVRLGTPGRNARIFFREKLPMVTVRWASATAQDQLQVSAFADFRRPSAVVPAQDGRFDFKAPAAGGFWWRVVDERGVPQSEARRFTLVKDVAPAPSSPAANELVDGTAGRALQLSWTPVPGVRRYRVEVAEAPGFAVVLAHAEVEASSVRLSHAFLEGSYFWRVRAADDERGESPYSPATPFQLFTAPLPAAPRLLSPQLEIQDARATP